MKPRAVLHAIATVDLTALSLNPKHPEWGHMDNPNQSCGPGWGLISEGVMLSLSPPGMTEDAARKCFIFTVPPSKP
jgi:hypothetical protein